MEIPFFIKNEIRMFWNIFLQQLGVAKMEKMLLFVLGLSLTQIHSLIGIVIAITGGCVTVFFAVRKHLRKEERDKEMHLLAIIKELDSMGEFPEGTLMEEKRAVAMKYVSKV